MADRRHTVVADLFAKNSAEEARNEFPLNFPHPIVTLGRLAALCEARNCWVT